MIHSNNLSHIEIKNRHLVFSSHEYLEIDDKIDLHQPMFHTHLLIVSVRSRQFSNFQSNLIDDPNKRSVIDFLFIYFTQDQCWQ